MMHDAVDIADPRAPSGLLQSCPVHAATPLVALPDLAAELGFASLRAKNESTRMGLGSFKALGGAYAVASLVRDRLAAYLGRVPAPEDLRNPRHGDALRDFVVVCASAGNHGLSVAAGARLFGVGCEVVLARTVPESFAERLRAKGATVVRAGDVYEDAMAAAGKRALRPGAVLVSDMATPDDMFVPSLVMQGYSVMAEELRLSFEANGNWPDTVALQAGVGGIAATATAHIRRHWPQQPRILVVEPDRASCIKNSVEAGRPVRADGPVSNMGRLDCKEPSLRAVEVLREMADEFIVVSDEEAEAAAASLSAHGLPTSPSGAAGLAGLAARGSEGAHALVLVTEGAIS